LGSGETLFGVEGEHLLKKISKVFTNAAEPWVNVLELQVILHLLDIVLDGSFLAEAETLLVLWSENFKDLDELIVVTDQVWLVSICLRLLASSQWETRATREHDDVFNLQWLLGGFLLLWCATILYHQQHLGKDTSKTPHVDLGSVFKLCKDNFGWSVPPGADMRGQSSLLERWLGLVLLFDIILKNKVIIYFVLVFDSKWWGICVLLAYGTRFDVHFNIPFEVFSLWCFQHASSLAEVAELDLAVLIDEEIARLNVSVHDTRGMDKVEGTQ
jgi:hypothetical protein